MATNDTILIDGILDNIISSYNMENTPENRGKAFEDFAISELLKNYDLTHDQILDGLVDGGDDGGIDGLYFFVNGNYIADKSTILPRTNAHLEIYVLTCKHHDTYELNPLESVDSSLSELFDMTIKTDSLNSKYKSDILAKRELLIYLYRKLSPALIKTNIYIRYISRGTSESIADNIKCKGTKIEATCNKLFSITTSEMKFIGSKELLILYRIKRNGTVQLKIKKGFQSGKDFVVLVQLADYYNFITDNEHQLKRYFFEENVRDYLGNNRTNTDIMNTLEAQDKIDFWNLNNGITLLTSSATLYDDTIEAENIQIVNGLQTTNTIFNYFSNGGTDGAKRSVLVKIIVSTEPIVRKNIIQATNNQSVIPLYSLHATDKIQKDIEEILYKHNIYYERKDKLYQNRGVHIDDIVTPLYLAGGYTSLVLKLPHRAVSLKSKFMNNPIQYNKIFNEQIPISVWINIATILKRVDKITPNYKGTIKTSQDKYLRSVRPIVSLIVTAKIIGKLGFGTNDIIKLNTQLITNELIRDVTQNTIKVFNNNNLKSIRNLSSRQQTNLIIKELATHYQLPDFNAIERRRDFIYDDYQIDEEFIETVKEMLPAQPWSVGIHKTIASQLGCTNAKVSRTIETLIDTGVFKKQINGHVISNEQNLP